jgi:hypothetical protein
MKTTKILTLLILSLLCFNVSAKRLYKIELVIFSQNMPNSESFNQTRSQIVWPKRLVDRSAYKQVSSEYMKLHGTAAALSGAQNYRTLMHVSWIQGVKGNSLSKAVKITNKSGTINGYFRLQRGNLVHMIADIEYSPHSVVYRLKEKRRFKLNETHYLDHPKFGILARISPVKK